jgi:cytidine deaminase
MRRRNSLIGFSRSGGRHGDSDERSAHMTDAELISSATALVGDFRSSDRCISGEVAAALLTRSGNVYTGVCIDTGSSLGFCAEHAAVAEMLKARESEIASIVAVTADGIIPPCGRCRELLWQANDSNQNTRVILADRVVTLRELLPHR